jgi:hypothetical protein
VGAALIHADGQMDMTKVKKAVFTTMRKHHKMKQLWPNQPITPYKCKSTSDEETSKWYKTVQTKVQVYFARSVKTRRPACTCTVFTWLPRERERGREREINWHYKRFTWQKILFLMFSGVLSLVHLQRALLVSSAHSTSPPPPPRFMLVYPSKVIVPPGVPLRLIGFYWFWYIEKANDYT